MPRYVDEIVELWPVISGFVSTYFFDLSAILSGLLAVAIIARKRREISDVALGRDEALEIIFSGVKVFFLVFLAVGAFVPELLTFLLSQQRILLFLTLTYAIWVEFDRLKTYYSSN